MNQTSPSSVDPEQLRSAEILWRRFIASAKMMVVAITVLLVVLALIAL